MGRKAILASMALGAVALAGATVIPVPVGCNVSAFDPTSLAVLNFALQLEQLESQSYLFALGGTGLNATELGVGGVAATGAYKANLSPAVHAFATELANTEVAHVKLLRSVLGACAVPAPPIDLSVTTFSTLANAATGQTTNALNLNPAHGDLAFLLSAFIYEDVGM